MAQVEMGDRVRIYYKGILDTGAVAEGTAEGDPFEFTVGDGQVREMFTRMVLGMEEGDSRTVMLGPEEAYGTYNPDFVIEVARSKFPEDADLAVGTRMEVQSDPDGTPITVTVKAMGDEMVTLDANHPLAGASIALTVQLLEIVG